MKDFCDLCLIAPTDSMEKLEDMHMMYCHSLVCIMREILENTWDIEIVLHPDPNKIIRKAIFKTDHDIKGMKELMTALTSRGIECLEVDSLPKKDKSDKYLLFVTTDPGFAKKAKKQEGFLLCVAGNSETVESIEPAKRDAFLKNGGDAIVPSLENVRILMKFLFDNSDKKNWNYSDLHSASI